MSVKTCRHIMENGQVCQSPALRKREYCYFHQEFRARRLKMARARARSERWWLDLPCIEDLASCEAATSRVIEGMAAQVIDPGLGKALLSGLRLAASNFKARKAWVGQSDYHNDRSRRYVNEYPGFEEAHDLPKDIDLDADPLKLFPMPEENEPPAASVPAQLLKDAATPVDYMNLEVTADDIEVWDVAEREGEQAGWKRAAELERNRRRRERRLERARYAEMARNRNNQTAAMRIARDEKRAALERQRQAAAVMGIPTNTSTAAETQAVSATTQAADAGGLGQTNSSPWPDQPGRKPAQSEAANTEKAKANTA